MKRIMFFFLTNLLVTMTLMVVATIVMNFMGVEFQSNAGLAVFCFIFGMGGAFISLRFSKWIAKRTMGLQELPATHGLTHKVHALARRAGLNNVPEVYFYNSPEVNAFATGPSRNNSLVAVSSGLIEKMTDDEVDGVLAHEVSHIANGDMVTMTLVQGIVSSFVMFATYIISNIVMNAIQGDDDDGRSIGDFFLYHIIHNILYTLLSFMSLPLVMYISRWREYRADAGAAKLAGKEKMKAALVCLKDNIGNIEKHDTSVEVMAISSGKSWNELFSSHPSLDKRIKALESLRL